MKIMHYALGFYPYRTGGMTKYVMDIMEEQIRKGYSVGMLWPGRFDLFSKKQKIISTIKNNGILSYEIVNPLPVPLLEGVMDISAYTNKCNPTIFREFLKKEQPDILHIHTLMGLHKELIEEACNQNIKLVYTTHDYYPLCPTVNLFREGTICQTGMDEKKCQVCNQKALSLKKIVILQSVPYRMMKDSRILRHLRKSFKRRSSEKPVEDASEMILKSKNYKELQGYYFDILQKISCFHYNSTVAKNVYTKLFGEKKGMVLPVLNSNIVDKRKKRVYNNEENLKITYLGPLSQPKGFFRLLEQLDKLHKCYKGRFCLNIYVKENYDREYINCHEPYVDCEIEQVFGETNVIIVPSLWNETYGFVTAEAICRGVPVLVSERVGSKDLIQDGMNGYQYAPESNELNLILERWINNKEELIKMNENICKMPIDFSMENHVKSLDMLYKA